MNFEEFQTVVTQIEAILNSRPITPISSDPNDLEALTPTHFLIGRGMFALPEPNLEQIRTNRLSRWQYISLLQQRFWKRWNRDYLTNLQSRNKWQAKKPEVIKNTLVLLMEDNLPPQTWVLGRVINTIAGSDGHVRVVDVKTSKGT